MIKFFKQKNNQQGFTLVETLVAISIFTVSILGLLVVLSQGLAETSYAKEKMIAGYLAQEGVEYVRNMRDTYMLYGTTSSAGWNDFKVKIAPCDITTGSCYFDDGNLDYNNLPAEPITTILLNACPTLCPNLTYDENTGRYGYNIFGNDSGFSRKIQVSQISADEIKVSSSVSWSQASGTQTITLSEDLFNWIQ